MSEIHKQLSTARASVDPKGTAAPNAPAAQVRFRRDEEASDEAAIDTSGEVEPQESTGAAEQPDRHDRSSALLAAGLGLLGIGGAASLGGAASTSGSKPAAIIDPPKTDQPRSDPPVTEQKPGTGTSQPPQSGGDPVSTPEQPKPDQPKPDEPRPDQPKPDDPKTDPVKPGTDPSPPEDPPAKPAHVPDAPTLALQKDTGSNDHDRITSSGLVNVSGLEAGASVAVSLDDGKTWISGLASTLPESLFGEDGAKHLLVKQIDADGHEGVVATLDFQIDRSAPAALSWSMPAGKPALGAADVIALQGVEAGAVVEYRLNATSEWQVAPDGKLPVSIFHADGIGHVEVRQTDLAGNASLIATVNAQIDHTPPAAPTVTLVNDTGASSTDGVTSSDSLRVGGLEAGASLLVSIFDGRWEAYGPGTTVIDSLIRWSDREQVSVQVKQVDAAGNEGEATPFSFVLDREALQPGWDSSSKLQSGTGVTLNAHDILGISRHSAGGQDSLAYRIDGGGWRDTLADGGLPLSVFGADGQHVLEIRETDLAGNVATRAIHVTLDTTPPAAPGLALERDDGANPNDRITSDPNLVVSGLQAGDTFQYRTNGGQWTPGWERGNLQMIMIRDVDASGRAGMNTVEVFLTDAAGNVGAISSFTFNYTPGGAVM